MSSVGNFSLHMLSGAHAPEARKDVPTTSGSSELSLQLVAAAALINTVGQVLLTRRPEGVPFARYWEFPGGKLEENEIPEQALTRELQEELGIDTHHSCLAPIAFSSHAYPEVHVVLLLFACRIWSGTPKPCERQELAWVRPVRLLDWDLLPGSVSAAALLSDFLAP